MFDHKVAPTTDELQTVCPGEQQTTVICSTNHTFLEWNVSTARQYEVRTVSYLDQNPTISPVLIKYANFTFSRVSSNLTLPLVSTVTMNNVTSNLEGTMISCTGLNSTSESTMVLVITIHIYDMDIGRLLILIL